MKMNESLLHGLVALCMLVALAGCDEGTRDADESDRVEGDPNALCAYLYAENNFQGKQVALDPSGTCDAKPSGFGALGSVAFSPNCDVEITLVDGTTISHKKSAAPADGTARPTLDYQAAVSGEVATYSCGCAAEGYPLVAEALEGTTRNTLAGENTLPLWDHGAIDLASFAGGSWNNAISAIYYPADTNAIFAQLGDGVAFPVGEQAGDDDILDLAKEYSVGVAAEAEPNSEAELQPTDYQDISKKITFLDPYRVTSEPSQ